MSKGWLELHREVNLSAGLGTGDTSVTTGVNERIVNKRSVGNSGVKHVRHRRRDWRGATRAFQQLVVDKENTALVFKICHALDGDAYKVDYIRLLSLPEGGRIAYERVELADKLMDDAFRASFPPGSVGEAYNKYLETEHFSVTGMIDESHKGMPPEEVDEVHPYTWFWRRIRDAHDIFHVLTGYGRDALGELCLLAFTFQETHALGVAFIAAGGFLRAHGPAAFQARKAVLEARRRGKRAVWLPGEDLERVLFEPLEEARKRLRLPAPVEYEKVPVDQRNLAII
jgi:ubiquinone biosynthesis protein COQ4